VTPMINARFMNPNAPLTWSIVAAALVVFAFPGLPAEIRRHPRCVA
jgi:hypothetical protein